MAKTKEVLKNQLESVWMTVKNCTVKSVSKPETIAELAEINKISPSEVFVRLTFTYNGKDYMASQKLRILGKENYKKLLDLKESKGSIDLDISNTEFFKIHKDVSLDDLFKDTENSTNSTNTNSLRNSVNTLFSK